MTMGRSATKYSRAMRRAFGLWPAWLPDSEVRIGDLGRIDKGVFVREGTIGELGSTLTSSLGTGANDLAFASHGVSAALDIQAGGGDPMLRITFSRRFGVHVTVPASHERRLSSRAEAAARLRDLVDAGSWDPDLCLVTSVIEADAALFAISTTSGGSIDLQLPAGATGIADGLAGGLSIVAEQGLELRSVVTGGCTPLFRLSQASSTDGLLHRGVAAQDIRLTTVDPRSGLGEDDD